MALIICVLLWIINVDAYALPFYQFTPDSVIIVTPDSVKNDTLKASVANDLQSQIKYTSADSITVSLTEDKWKMYRNASLIYEDLDLKADYIEIDFNNRTLFASGITDSAGIVTGKPVFKQGSDSYNVETVNYNFKTKRGRISDISTQQGEGFIRGEKVIKSENDNYYIRDGFFTTCDKAHPDFCMRTQKLKMIKRTNGNQVITGPAYMEIADVPTPLAIPFGFFPADKGRKSGVIFPAYGESQELGFFLRNGGWYFGINDYVDASITGDIYSKGSWALHGSTNYALRYKFNGSFGIDYSINKIGEKELPDYSVNKNFFVNWRHSQDGKARPGTTFSASVSAGSADYYNNNVTTGLNYLTNTFNSSVAYSKTWGTLYNLSVAARHSQNNLTRIFEITLPEIGFGIGRVNPFKRKVSVGREKWFEKIGFSVTSNFRNQITSPDSILFSNDAVERIQNGLQTSIPVTTSFQLLKYFTLTPAVNFNSKWYLKTYEQRYDSSSKQILLDTIEAFKTANEMSLSAGLNTRIYGMANFKKGSIAAIRHVVIPTIGFSIRPDYGRQHFGYYKTVTDSMGIERLYSIFNGSTPTGISYNSIFGGPAAGKYGFLSFGVDNILEMKTRQVTDTAVNLKKIKILEGFSLNTGYNLAATQFKWSVLNMAARTTILEKFTLNGTAVFDPYAIDSSGLRINAFQYNNNGNLFRFTNATVALGFSLNSVMFNDKDKTNSGYYKIPWNLTFSYSYNYSKPALTAVKTQTLYCFGDFSMTERWRINFSSGWDFIAKDVSYTQLAIVRDLHCWEMRLSWVPFGLQQNYFFTINVKAGMLRDLKLDKKRDQFDR